MSLQVDVVHAQHDGNAPPTHIAQTPLICDAHQLNDAQANQHSNAVRLAELESSPPPRSQESLQSTASKETTFTSEEPADNRQLTPTSPASRHDSLSPVRSDSDTIHGSALPAYRGADACSPSTVELSKTSVPCPIDAKAGQKRTADGMIKTSVAHTAGSPFERGAHHGRTTSNASRSSQLGELSAQLKARLTYAKVKIENGWETRAFHEIEPLASHSSSPASVYTDGARAFKSPNNRLSAINIAVGMLHSKRPLTAPSRHLQYGNEDVTLAHTNQHLDDMAEKPAPARASLAPALEFAEKPKAWARPQGALASTNGSSEIVSSDSNQSSGEMVFGDRRVQFGTPCNLQAPGQSAMEQDAIETLLFMRSPGNSAAFAQATSSRPAAPPASTDGLLSAVGPAPMLTNGHASSSISAQAGKTASNPEIDCGPFQQRLGCRNGSRSVLANVNLQKDEGIDKVLDTMRHGSSFGQEDSDDDEDV